MLSYEEKQHIREILSDGLGIRPDINLAYYLNIISDLKKEVQIIKCNQDNIVRNQQILGQKLDKIIRMIGNIN